MDRKEFTNLDKKYAQIIANYLLKRIEEDEYLRDKMENTEKTLKQCLSFIKNEAQKEAQDNVAVIEDSQVFEWAVHFYLEDSIGTANEPKKVEAKINAEVDEDDVEEETEKVEKDNFEKVIKEAKKSVEKRAVERKKDNPKVKKDKDEKIRVINGQMCEQLSLF